ncbi:MAG: hypothetical protein ABEJ87_00240 [Candidatus Nanohalobium sp.]
MDEDLRLIEEYAGLEDTELHRDFEAIVSDVFEIQELQRSFTSSQLPDGFVSETVEGGDFGFYAEKIYDSGRIEVEYTESSDVGFESRDASQVTVSVEAAGYEFSKAWDQNR